MRVLSSTTVMIGSTFLLSIFILCGCCLAPGKFQQPTRAVLAKKLRGCSTLVHPTTNQWRAKLSPLTGIRDDDLREMIDNGRALISSPRTWEAHMRGLYLTKDLYPVLKKYLAKRADLAGSWGTETLDRGLAMKRFYLYKVGRDCYGLAFLDVDAFIPWIMLIRAVFFKGVLFMGQPVEVFPDHLPYNRMYLLKIHNRLHLASPAVAMDWLAEKRKPARQIDPDRDMMATRRRNLKIKKNVISPKTVPR